MDPLTHMTLARSLVHPFEAQGLLHQDLSDSADWLLKVGRRAVATILRRVVDLEAKAKELDIERNSWDFRASATAKQLGCKFHLPIWDALTKTLKVEDRSSVKLLNHGLPIVR